MRVEKVLNESKAKNATTTKKSGEGSSASEKQKNIAQEERMLNQLKIRNTVNCVRKFMVELNATERWASASTAKNLAIQLPSAPNRAEGLLEA